jgi:hypothetical protein
LQKEVAGKIASAADKVSFEEGEFASAPMLTELLDESSDFLRAIGRARH